MAAIVDIISRRGSMNEAHFGIILIRLSYDFITHYCNLTLSYLKQLYTSNTLENFSCKGGCALHVFLFKRRFGLGYRLMILVN